MKIAITGANGLVGQALARRLSCGHELFALSHRELDLTDAVALERFVAAERPDLLLNCAVIDVDRCEREPALATAVNVTGPQVLAAALARSGGAFMHFSTNYVFAGRTPGHVYTQADEAVPLNVYGQTKLDGERAVLAANPRSWVVRTSWVFGRGKASFLATLPAKLRAGESVKAITDVWASATFVNDLVERVLQLLAQPHYGLYHVVNEGVCSYHEFALETARLLNLPASATQKLIIAVSEAQAQRVAERPRYTPMRCQLSEQGGLPPLRSWQAALHDYVAQTAE